LRVSVADESGGDLTVEELAVIVAIVAIDHARAHRGQSDERGAEHARIIDTLLSVPSYRAAPTLLIELAHELPKFGEQSWQHTVCASVARHDRTWPYLVRLSDLPGFALSAAMAAAAAGRDVTWWLSHTCGSVRTAAAWSIRPVRRRNHAAASVLASWGASDQVMNWDWSRLLRDEMEPLLELPSLGAYVQSLFARCADERRYAIEHVARRREPAELLDLAVADELACRRQLQGWPHKKVAWERWHAVEPTIPLDADERAVWLRHRLRDVGRDELSARLDESMSGEPQLPLDPDEGDALYDLERCEALAALVILETVAKGSKAR
jgi:hypothetical protein